MTGLSRKRGNIPPLGKEEDDDDENEETGIDIVLLVLQLLV